jgi:hypothetical protein
MYLDGYLGVCINVYSHGVATDMMPNGINSECSCHATPQPGAQWQRMSYGCYADPTTRREQLRHATIT